ADTDVYNILFAVYATWFFFLSLKEHTVKKKAIYAGLTGFTLGLFSTVWLGWWYVFDFILGSAAIYLVCLLIRLKGNITHIRSDESVRSISYTLGLFFVAAALFVSLFSSITEFTNSVTGPLDFLALKEASKGDLWPNVYTTVAELNAASREAVISSLGGNGLFLLSLLGICLLLFYKKEQQTSYQPFVAWLVISFISLQFPNYLLFALGILIVYCLSEYKGDSMHTPFAILIILWYVGIFFASSKGIRFVMMMVPPFTLAIGAAIGILYRKAIDAMEKIDIKPHITKVLFIIIIILAFMPYVRGNMNAVGGDIPIINDAWYNSLTKIKQESQPNAIVNSWWDFGHHFKYFTDRAVTFDGASQNSPMAHWIGKVLLTSDENEAIGILRMLDCGSNSAFDALNKEVNDTHTSVDILYDIITLSKGEAQSYLSKKGISKETTDAVLKNTHCTPPEDYFITSEDMVAKAGVWAHFGSWDFNKADIWINANGLPKDQAIAYIKKKASVSDTQANALYNEMKALLNEGDANNWIASWPGYSQQSGCTTKGTDIICGGITINNETKDVSVNTNSGLQKPYSIIYKDGTSFVEKKFPNGFAQSVLLIQEGSSYSIVVTTPELSTSMFTRLFFYNGAGLNHFNHFYEERQVIGQNIIVWKVAW
ncbi:MAG TPA: hypothetical protein VKE88_03145, partial [Candidatus Nanoarchaeia archaeon]|nr:hypothetical protein [Candidatus Nanoarchaeia archaeon]